MNKNSDSTNASERIEPHKLMVIDPSGEIRDFVRYCAARAWANLIITPYDFAKGRPGPDFNWEGFDLILLEQRLNIPTELGLTWLKEIRAQPETPPVIMLVGAPSDDLRRDAKRAGAAAFLGKDEVTPNVFVRCVERVLSGAPSTGETARVPMLPGLVRGDATGTLFVPTRSAEAAAQGANANESGKEIEISGYVIQRLLARGNIASVYLARGTGDTQIVALKVMRLGGHADPQALQRFMQEYQLIRRLQHPHVIAIHERGFSVDMAYIAMEYCAGGDLKSRIRQGISPAQTLDYMRQIALALKAVHECGIVHRDLKPANVLLRDPYSLVLTDFGIAKDLEANLRLTMVNSILGSLYYVSPESIRHDKPDHRSDFYSVGAIFYQMLTGIPPYKATTVTAMLEAHANAPIPRLPAPLAAAQSLIDGLLAKDPDDRFQSADDLLDGIAWIAKQSGWVQLTPDRAVTSLAAATAR